MDLLVPMNAEVIDGLQKSKACPQSSDRRTCG